MKRFLTRACAKIGRFIWSWGFLKFCLFVITLITFFYVEEDWRGAHVWAATKATWQSNGISFDPQTYIPPAIPDDENLAAIPLFKQEPINPAEPTVLDPKILKIALRTDLPGNELPPTGGWQKGKSADMAQIQTTISKDFAQAFPQTMPPASTLAQFEALYPFQADLRAAASIRPLCRFEASYTYELPATRPLGLLVQQVRMAKILNLHALLALADHKPDLALADIKTNLKLVSGIRRDPSLIAGLVSIAVIVINNSAIYEGLAQHAWSDAQLAEIQDELARIDFLQDYQFAMRSEALTQMVPNTDFIKNHRRYDYFRFFTQMGEPNVTVAPWIFYVFLPDGWLDISKSKSVNVLLTSAETTDPRAHRVFPGTVNDLQYQVDSAKARWDVLAPWNFLYILSTGPVLSGTINFCRAAAWIDETRIACALERYRLAHGAYPSSLDALAPDYIAVVPHDVITGEPYPYHLKPDGLFLLYSIGWNQTDEHGQIAYIKDSTHEDNRLGDWAWPTPPAPTPLPR